MSEQNGAEMPRYEVEKVGLEIIGSTNNATNWNDSSKAATLDNFKKEPTLVGGGDGALDPALKQPVVVPPTPKYVPSSTAVLNLDRFADKFSAGPISQREHCHFTELCH